MNLKAILSSQSASRLESQARKARRALRDLTRHENSRINSIEKRARGLRLYVAWSRKRTAKTPFTNTVDWSILDKVQASAA